MRKKELELELKIKISSSSLNWNWNNNIKGYCTRTNTRTVIVKNGSRTIIATGTTLLTTRAQ